MPGQNKNDTPNSGNKNQDMIETANFRGRRALIKGAAASLPMILTLQSGAALARSSNLISGSSEASAKDANGNTLCMDTSYATQIGDNLYDLGPFPEGVVNEYPNVIYKTLANNGSKSLTVGMQEVCESSIDTAFYFQNGAGWQSVPGGNGCLVSLTAISSFADGTFLFQDPTRM